MREGVARVWTTNEKANRQFTCEKESFVYWHWMDHKRVTKGVIMMSIHQDKRMLIGHLYSITKITTCTHKSNHDINTVDV